MGVDTTLSGELDPLCLTGDVVRVEGPPGLPGRITAEDVTIEDLGKCRLPSPVAAHLDARRDRITQHFTQRGTDVTLKSIDPSYAIRSVPASPSDSVYCWSMARNAVHAAMAGNTEMLIGRWHGRFVHVPMPLATRQRKQVDPTDDPWMSVIEATGQPKSFV